MIGRIFFAATAKGVPSEPGQLALQIQQSLVLGVHIAQEGLQHFHQRVDIRRELADRAVLGDDTFLGDLHDHAVSIAQASDIV